MPAKAAIVIGVDSTGNLARLESAAAGAQTFAAWLEEEGYDVQCLTDADGPVTARLVEEAVARFVTLPPRYALLVVYFSGHGSWHARADRWLLSGAPVSTTEAINLDGAMDLAQYSGIPNIVFISDACRSIPDSRAAANVRGIDAFPNYAEISTSSKVDSFMATSQARAAYEGQVNGRQQSMLTCALMSAYKTPEPGMVRRVQEGPLLVPVVPNRALEGYLQNKVDELLAAININLTQNIEARVYSDDTVYIARAQAAAAQPFAVPPSAGAAKALRPPGRLLPTSAGLDAATTLDRALAPPAETGAAQAAALLTVTLPATELKLADRQPGPGADWADLACGLMVQGGTVSRVVTSPGQGLARAELVQSGDGGAVPAIIRLEGVDPAVSVAVQLSDGRLVLLAGLKGFVGHAHFNRTGLANVSYLPAAGTPRWQLYADKTARIDRLRAMVALAVEENTFQLRSDAEAENLGEQIRLEKSIDPTLGLYAAHALSQAGRLASVLSILHFMRGDLGVDLFDVRLLAARRDNPAWRDYPLVPACPMLTQSWNLLRPRGMRLAPALHRAMPGLGNALWTTFQPEAAAEIINAMTKGEL